MKNTSFIGLFALMSIIAIGFIAAPIYGQATVIRGAGCFLNLGPAGFASTTDTQIVFTNNQQSNSLLRCQVDDVPNPTGHAIVIKGLACFNQAGQFTTNSHTVVSASGQTTLTCHFRD